MLLNKENLLLKKVTFKWEKKSKIEEQTAVSKRKSSTKEAPKYFKEDFST